jgi:hypothetical protein
LAVPFFANLLLSSFNTRNFTRVASGPELGAYYHEFFLRDQPHLAAQMFCKNARTKIAMASSEPEPAALQSQLSSAQAPDAARLDASHILMRNTVESSMQMSLGQQLNMCNRFNPHQQQQVQMQMQFPQKPMMVINNNAALSLLMNEILAQKQQQQRMLQLQQLTAVNLRQQSKKPRSKNNSRASAA